MNDKAEKIYGDAFFSLCREENPDKLKDVLGELTELSEIFSENPGFVKLMGTPTVSLEEKLSLLNEMIKAGNLSELTGNLLCVLCEKNRMSCFSGLVKHFKELYNDEFRLAEITVTTSDPLTDAMKKKIIDKMSKVIGRTVSLNEKVDKKLIGGIVIDYGSKRYDGSVKSRLDALKGELGSVI